VADGLPAAASNPRSAHANRIAPQTVKVRGATLSCWDTGGPGAAVVLLHPAVGNGHMFGHLQASLASAGYRSISYSRRGHFGSDPVDAEHPVSATDDLMMLADELRLEQFHLFGTALGGFTAVDAALSHPHRILGLAVSASLCGLQDPEFLATTERLAPPSWHALPKEIRELGPSYRASCPEGVRLWAELSADPPVGGGQRPTKSRITFATLEAIRAPSLFIAGDADPYAPPPRMRDISAAVPGSRLVTVRECGHSPYWEQPEILADLLLAFLPR
jgi:pimeloyl-ACP methyl ester carboxylesterase